MRPEPVNYSEYFATEDDVSSTAAVNEADDIFYEEKKRSAVEDENPGVTKKSKADCEGQGEQIPAALPRPRLPNLILSMRDEPNYRQIMNEAIQKIVGKEFCAVAEKELGTSILQKLQGDYHLLDTNGQPADDGVALHKIRQCLRNKYIYEMRKSKSDQQLMILDMTKDKNYERIIIDAFEKISGEDFDGTVEETCNEVLQELKQRYLLVDRSGKSIDDRAAFEKLVQSIRNKHYRSLRSECYQQPQPTAPSPVPARTTTTRESLIAGNDLILDMRVNKFYKDTMNKFFNDYVNNEYDDIVETGEAILLELQRSLGTEGKFLKRAGNGLVEVDSEAVLQMILQRLEKKSQSLPFRNTALPRSQSRTQDHSGRAQLQNQEVVPRVQTLTRDKLSEAERVNLLEYFGHSIVADYLKKESCGWKFQYKRGPIDDEWVAVKEGFTKTNAQEDVTMLTGVRKIANWAFREGHFEEYANDEFGRTMLERKGLSVENYMIIFDRESEEQTGAGALNRRTVSPNSSSRENEDGRSNMTLQLRGEELSEYMKVYKDISMKRTPDSDVNAKEFYGLLQKFLETEMTNTQQWNAKKYILAHFLRRFEDAVKDAAAINQGTGSSWFRDGIIPAIIEEAKEKLLGV